MTYPKPSSPAVSDILAVFQEELPRAASMPDSAAAGPAQWLRFVGCYRSLVRLPRKAWRALKRRWRRSLGALALLCAFGQAPVLLLRELRDVFPRFARYYQRFSALAQLAPRGWKWSSAAIAMLLALSQAPLHAATFTVNHTADAKDAVSGDGFCNTTDGVCTLRAAIQETNTLEGPDTIIVPGGIYLLSIAGAGENASAQGDLDITDDLAIKGGGAHSTIIDGGEVDRVFHVPTVSAVDISDLTIQNGNASNQQGSGGGIFNGLEDMPGGSLTLTNVNVMSNSATFGGGIMNGWGATTTVINTTVDANSADFGGGIYTRDPGPLRLINSTVSGNSASCGGGGIDTFASGTASLTSSTVSNNSAPCGGGGIFRESTSGEVGLTTSIVANNPSGNDCAGGVNSNGHNLDSDNTCGLTSPGDLANTDPLLGPLQDNSGPTKTHALPGDSPAVDVVPAASCAATTDQRGVTRPQDGDVDMVADCDIGALEFLPLDLAVAMSDSPDPVAVDGGLTYRVTVKNLGDAEASAVTLTDTLPAGATFISASPSHGNCSPSGGTVACSLGPLPAGSNAIVDIVVTPLSVGTMTNTATVTASQSEVIQDNNTATENTTVTSSVTPLVDDAEHANPQVPVPCTGAACRVRITCKLTDGTGCSNRVNLFVRASAVRLADEPLARVRRIKFASGIANIPPGDTRRVKLRLTKKGKAIVQNTDKKRLRGILAISNTSGTLVSETRVRIRLR